MIENDELILNIESFSNLGFGIARQDGKVVFVANACPGDEVEVKIDKVCKNYTYATAKKVITPSAHRTEPICPLQKVCGSCQLGFIDYDYQLELKRQNVEDAMRKIGGLEVEVNAPVPSPQKLNYRHKIQYPVSETKNSKRILAGYFKQKSHEIVNIKYCPVQPSACDEIIEFIRNKAFDFGISGFNEKKHTGDLRHIVLRASADSGKILVTLVVNATQSFARLKDFAQCIFDEFENVTGVCANFNPKKTNVILGSKSECLCGKDYIIERILGKTFKIGANTFFQINPKSAENIFAYVKKHIEDNFDRPTVLDAYSGVSAFGITVSDVAKEVVCVEENTDSCNLAHEIARENKVRNIEINNMDAGKFFAREKCKFDVVILDPPRSGCTEESLDNALKVCKGQIIYVSCNPATLARDLKYLTEKGAKIAGKIQPFDMFCHTYHIENVAIINVAN